MKNFDIEYQRFLFKIKEHKPFSLTRFGDGEWSIFDGRFLDIRNKEMGEFLYDPDRHQKYRLKLTDSLLYQAKDYYVGIMTSCCLPKSKSGGHTLMLYMCNQPDENLTFATLFTNAN